MGLPYKISCLFNTNNFAESFFKKFKYQYLNKKTNSRIDSLFQQIIKISTNLIKEEIVKDSSNKKENKSYRCKNSLTNHKRALELQQADVKQNTSTTFTYKAYKVKLNKKYTNYISSKIICSECQIHFDEFSCNCLNYNKSKNICKHIHLVSMIFFGSQNLERYRISKHSNQISFIKSAVSEKSTNPKYYRPASKTLPTHLPKESLNKQSYITTKRNSQLFPEIHACIETLGRLCSQLPNNNLILPKLEQLGSLIGCSPQPTFMPNEVSRDINKRKIVVKQRELPIISSNYRKLNFRKFAKRRGRKVVEIIKSFNYCRTCKFIEDSHTNQYVNWISCLRCSRWHHVECVKEKLKLDNMNFICCL
eukprot:GAHX01002914.1.p1 GENE.GAHX01002914.1~~GAHX01002914.1.p1  ORF type:complete len:364 (-),score=24.23 GAHX01002914.1:412-1503(-)